MEKWIIPANIEIYDVVSSFAENGFVDWTQGQKNYDVNDIVYIYCGQSIQKVLYKTIVEKTDIPFSESTDDEKFWLNDESYEKSRNGKFVRLKLLEQIDNEELSYENLRKNGLNGPIRGAMRLKDNLLDYVEKYFKEVDIETEVPPKVEKKLWMVRAGEGGFLIEEFKNMNIVSIGWGIGDVKNNSIEDIKKLLKEKYPDETDKTIGTYAGEITTFIKNIKKGDNVLSPYPNATKYFLGEILSDYYYDEKVIGNEIDGGELYNKIHDVKWLSEIPREDVSHLIKFLRTPLSVYKINDKAEKDILNFIGGNSLFMCDEKRNVIYFGAPGTGKSYNLKKDMENILHITDEKDYERVTFHPDYSYANFVGTYKPHPEKDKAGNKTGEITYKYIPGPFMRSLVKALKNPNKPFLLIIEEINRSNVAAVFGDVFQLLDRDENYESEYSIETSEDMRDFLKEKLYKDYEKIKIPPNMFIWATMNSADQGVFPMDTAFKRRWDFKYLSINNNQHKIEHIKANLNNQEISWNDLRKAINDELLGYGINEDKLIGPFFAFNKYLKNEKGEFEEITDNEFKEIFENKIIMYLFEDAAKPRRKELFEGAKEGETIIYSKVCELFRKDEIKIFSSKIQEKILKDNTEAID